MRALKIVALLAPLALAACGGEDRTVVVNPAPAAPAPAASSSTVVAPTDRTVVVPPAGPARVCPYGAVTC
ncbi:MAG: hypothetical protein AB7O45_01010 [Alphaproteobacteria bacterium]